MEFGKIENIVEAKFRIVTPMFLGGVDHMAEEIRPASVKGMLRFWWRALNWSQMRKNAADNASALRRLHDEEARLFGCAASEGKGGQGVFLLSIKNPQVKPHNWGKPEPQIGYLLGLGLFHFKNGVTRTSMDGEFIVALRFRDSVQQNDRASILDAFKTFGLLGGMGSRSRRGLGAVAMIDLRGVEKFTIAANEQTYFEQVQSLFANNACDLPPFTAFSVMSKMSMLTLPTAMGVLKQMGDELGMYRGWGREGKVFGKPREKRFTSDHNNMQAAANGQQYPNVAPRRLVFGMPHNYRFSSGGSASIQNTLLKLQRRASPLFIHIHQFQENGTACGVMFMLPAQFLPANDQVEIKGKGSKRISPNVDWKVMEELLQRKAFKQGAKA